MFPKILGLISKDPVAWNKVTHAGTQIAQWDFQNKKARTSPPRPAFVLEVPLCHLRPSICDFVPPDQIVQKAYFGIKSLSVTFQMPFYYWLHNSPSIQPC